ncbi:MAG: DUF5686 family protein [Candidatus Zixiibacteriota bacterium]
MAVAQQTPHQGTVSGQVTDSTTGLPISAVTVQLEGTGISTLTNDEGRYRLLLSAGSHVVKFSHVAYYSQRATVVIAQQDITQDIRLQPSLIEIRGIRVYEKAYDPAQQIIIEAIARKKQMLAKLRDYSFDAYAKLVVRDRKKPDSTNIFLIVESQVTGLWERPDKYKQTVVARRQSANVPADAILILFGDLLSFYQNRDEMGSQRIVTPLADDALDHYNFYLLDTIQADNKRVFVLEIEPKNQVDPLYVGRIQIADSSFGVVSADLGWNDGVRLTGVSDAHLHMDFAQFTNEYWMPVEIDMAARFKLAVPLPGFPKDILISYVASLHSYRLQEGMPPGSFGEVAYEISPQADKVDSAAWNRGQTIPLTTQELRGYARIDSIQRARPFVKKALPLALALPLFATTQHDLFHFNRTEGAYAGLGGRFNNRKAATEIRAKAGYAFDARYWQFAFGATRTLSERQKLTLGAEYHNEMRHRPTLSSGIGGNATLSALFFKSDPFDYFREEEFSIYSGIKLVDRTRFSLAYHDTHQQSTPTRTDFSLFEKDKVVRDNQPILDGQLRSVTTALTYDSRPLLRRKGKDERLFETQYTNVTAEIERSSPTFLNSDFDFVRYAVSVDRRQQVLGLGTSTLRAYWGGSDKALPPQRYFTVDHNVWSFYSIIGFQTLGEHNFYGNQVLAVTLQHDFGRLLFAKSRLPFMERIPFTLNVHGGAFWTDFRDHAPQTGDRGLWSARTAYSELGFTVGNLTPFLVPFNLALSFTWQLSAYDTNRFSLGWGIAF